MKVIVFDTHGFERDLLKVTLEKNHDVHFVDVRLDQSTVELAHGYEAVVVFIHDDLSKSVLEQLKNQNIKFVVTRSAGFNHIDLEAAKALEIRVANVPKYSPYAVAEHAITLMLALNRKIIRSHHRLMDLNFSLNGLVGFDMHKKTVGIIGLGKIGKVVARILCGFGCKILAYDVEQDQNMIQSCCVEYVDLNQIYKEADIISLHIPLKPETKYIIDQKSLSKMKKGVMLINTSRGGLIHTKAVIDFLKTGHVGYLGLDVYEEEEELFFEDHSDDILQDDVIARLMTFPNVLITSHQAFLTKEALDNIVSTTLHNITCFEENTHCENELT